MVSTLHKLVLSFVQAYKSILVHYGIDDATDPIVYRFHSVRSRHNQDSWYMFIDHKWTRIDYDRVLDVMLDHARHVNYTNYDPGCVYAANLCEAFHDDSFIERMDTDYNLICFKNGVYDIRNGMLRDGDFRDDCTLCTGYEYVQYNADSDIAKEIDQYIDTMFPGDKDVFLKKITDILLSTDPKCRSSIIYGNSCTGKTVLASLLREMTGEYASVVEESDYRPSKQMLIVRRTGWMAPLNDVDRLVKNIRDSSNGCHKDYYRRQRANNLIEADTSIISVINDEYIYHTIHLTRQITHRVDIQRIAPMFMSMILLIKNQTPVFDQMSCKKSARK